MSRLTCDDATPVVTIRSVTEGDWRTDTAERKLPRAVPDARTPPSAVAPPPPPRYPLYADEVEGYTPHGPLTTGTDPTPTSVVPTDARPAADTADHGPASWWHTRDDGRDPGDDTGGGAGYGAAYDAERRSPVLWILVAALALVLVAVGWWFVVRDGGSGAPSEAKDRSPQASSPGRDGTVELAGRAAAKAPRTAPPNDDVDGKKVSYDASNMLDGVPDTAWRVAGDATGMELSFTLHQSASLHQVGLINGYAKTSTDDKGRSFDWYLGNRRVKAVVWVFDDGSKVRQQLDEDRKLQTVDVQDVTTKRVLLRLVAVSKPGTGTASRDFTAISEVSLVGVPAG